jgi:2-methylaconitate cis-trans-isomerase PrpF
VSLWLQVLVKSVFVTEKVNCGAVGFVASATACNEGRVSTAGFRFKCRIQIDSASFAKNSQKISLTGILALWQKGMYES